MTEYNITDEEINEVTAKMEDQFAKLGEFLEDRTPEEKLETINKQVEWLQQEKYYLEEEIALKSKERRQQFIDFFKKLSTFAKTVDGLSLTSSTDADNMPVIEVTYAKNNEEVFTYSYFYQYDFPKQPLADLKEEITMAIAVADQLERKLDYEQVYNAKHLLNPIELTGENVIVSFDKRADNHIAIEVKKTTHTYGDGFILKINDTTTVKTDFKQLYPLLKAAIQNINDWQNKTTVV